ADRRMPVATCMSTQVACIEPAAWLDEAAEVMRERAIGCLPVVEEDRVVGIVTRGDLRRAGLPADDVATAVCASCHSQAHVRVDAKQGGVPFCLECLERAHPPEPFEDIGVGD